MYLFCGKADTGLNIKRYDTFDWRLSSCHMHDGPYMDINTTTTYLCHLEGYMVPDMTSNTAPTRACAASSAKSPATRSVEGF